MMMPCVDVWMWGSGGLLGRTWHWYLCFSLAYVVLYLFGMWPNSFLRAAAPKMCRKRP
jgi:hypothetical protein